jgi:peptidoglycan/LPS O-acetylase OafA/YrhL
MEIALLSISDSRIRSLLLASRGGPVPRNLESVAVLARNVRAWGFSVVDALFATLLAIAIMVPSSTRAAICRFRFFAEMGRVCYCLYVIHQAVDLACHKLLLRGLPRFDTWQTALVSIVAAVVGYALAALSWRFFEDPLLRRGHALKY